MKPGAVLRKEGRGLTLLSVKDAPYTVEEAAQYAAAHDQQDELREEKPQGKDWSSRFTIRRFAGPEKHTRQLEQLRVAHLTDLHVGRVTPYEVQETAVRLTNAEKPDLVVITGYFVCHSQMYLEQLTHVVRSFEAPVVCVLGNHDYWSGAHEVRWALVRAGAEVLDNRHTVITLRHQRLQLIGLDDAYTGHARREEAVRGLRKDLATLALSHIAEEADGLWDQGVPLVLSGHTHAGQVTLARMHELALGRFAGHRYIHGLYGAREAVEGGGTGAVYVGAGIGAAVMPVRLGERAKREITIFELGHEPGTFEEPHAPQVGRSGRKPNPKKQHSRAAAVLKKQRRAARRERLRVRRSTVPPPPHLLP